MQNKSRIVAVVAAIGLLATAGCGGSDHHKTGADKPHKVDIHTKTPSGDNGGLKHVGGAINALDGFTCAPDASGAWTATGTLKNSEKSTRKFLVSASVVKAKGNEVLGSAEKTYEIAPGKSQKVALAKVFVEKGKQSKGHLCVPRVVSGT
jgi:hypothetical protein